MRIFKELVELKNLKEPISITIGIFDGVHKGHRAILKRLKEVTKEKGTAIVLSFSNHPLEVLQEHNIPLINTLEERITLFEKEGIDILFLIPFTKEIAKQSAEEFLKNLKATCSFTNLILGFNAVLGKKRGGTPEKVKELGTFLNFNVEYLPPICDEEGPISSTRIRKLIKEGRSQDARALLGR